MVEFVCLLSIVIVEFDLVGAGKSSSVYSLLNSSSFSEYATT